MKAKVKAIPVSAEITEALSKIYPESGPIDLNKLPTDLRDKIETLVVNAIAEEEGCGTCPGCDAELREEYEAKVPSFVRDMIDTMIGAKNYKPAKHEEAMRDAMKKAIAHADGLDHPDTDLVAEVKDLAKELHERFSGKPAEEVVDDMTAGDNPLATLVKALEQRVKVNPDLLRDPEFQESIKHQIKRAMLDTIIGQIKGKKAEVKPEYEPKYEMIAELVILRKEKGGKLERVYQQFVKVTDDDEVSDRAFKELEAEMLKIAPDSAWSIIDTEDELVSAIGCKVDGVKYQAKQTGHRLRVG